MKDAETGSADGGAPVAAMFEVGPPGPVTDSRDLPAVTPDEEALFVRGRDLGDAHPDNRELDVDPDLPVGLTDEQDDDPDEELPDESELDALVADDEDDLDASQGFDFRDLPAAALLTIAQLPDVGGE